MNSSLPRILATIGLATVAVFAAAGCAAALIQSGGGDDDENTQPETKAPPPASYAKPQRPGSYNPPPRPSRYGPVEPIPAQGYAESAPAAPPPVTPARNLGKLAVLNLSVQGNAIRVDDAIALTDVIRSRLTQKIGDVFKVISKEKVFEIMQKSERTAAQCTGECVVETARAIGADFVVTGTITKLSGKLLIVLEAKRSRDGASMAGADLEVAESASLRSSIGTAVEELAATLRERAAAN